MALRQKRGLRGTALTEIMRHFFLYGLWPGLELFPHGTPGRVATFMLSHPDNKEKALCEYEKHRAEVLEFWKAQGKRGLPWAERELQKRERKAAKNAKKKNDNHTTRPAGKYEPRAL